MSKAHRLKFDGAILDSQNELVNKLGVESIENQQFELKLELSPSEKLLSLLTPNEIFERLDETIFGQLREDRRVERKSASVTPRGLGDYFSMWANTCPDGGLIFIGVEDDGRITGCQRLPQPQLNDLEDAGRIFCSDANYDIKRLAVKNDSGVDDFVMVVRVNCRPEKVVRNSAGKAFIRSGDKKREMPDHEIREQQVARGEIHHELETIAMTYPDDFDGNLLKEFARNVRRIKELSYIKNISEILQQFHLGTHDNGRFIPNNACCLLFAKDPSIYFPGCKIRFLRFEGEAENSGEKYALIKDVTIEGPIPKIILEAERVISGQLREFSALDKDGRFYAVPEYPLIAWYEAIVNAVSHRSYHGCPVN